MDTVEVNWFIIFQLAETSVTINLNHIACTCTSQVAALLPVFVPLDLWPPNNPDLNPFDYQI